MSTAKQCAACSRDAEFNCTDCGRRICARHSAQSPVAIDSEIRLVPVCFPICSAPFWVAPKEVEEWRPPNR